MDLPISTKVKKIFSDTNNFFLLLLLFTPFIYIDKLFSSVELPRFAYVALLSCLWLSVWLIQYNKKHLFINWNPLFLLIIFLLVLSLSSYIWGSENTFYQAELYFSACLVILCFMSMQAKTKPIIQLSRLVSLIAAVCAIIGILQNFGWNILNYKQIASPASTFINKNFAANFFDLVLPVVITLFLISNNKKEAWISAFSLSLIFSYILLTKSRGTYLATLVTLSLVLVSIKLYPWLRSHTELVSQKYKKQIIFILFVPLLLYSLPNKVYKPDFSESRYIQIFSGNQQNSILLRLKAYQNSLDLIKENPILGIGLGGFQLHFRPYTQSVLANNKIFSDFIYLHNDPLQLIIELGIIGGITVFLLFFLLFRTTLRYFSKLGISSEGVSSQIQILYIGFFIALISSIFHSLFSFPFHQATSATFFSIWLGIVLSISSRKTTITILNNSKTTSYSIICLAVMFLILISTFYFHYIKSSYYMKNAIISFNMKTCNKATNLAILSNRIYGKDYLAQSQGIGIITNCPVDASTQLRFADNVLKFNPTHPWALFLAGMSYYKLGNYEAAHKILKSLSFLYPYFTGSYTFLGHIALKNKQHSQAKLLYTRALRLEPKNNTAKYFLNELIKEGY